MMKSLLYDNIANSTAHKLSRDTNSAYILSHPELFNELIDIAMNPDDKYHYKACWILELVLEKNLALLTPYRDQFCNSLLSFKHDGAMRSISKICMFLSNHHIRKNKSGEEFLTEKQLQQIAEACFNWLIGDAKVASKAYSIRALFEIGKLQQWIYPDLKAILEKDFPMHSAAYKAVAKQILPKIK